MHVFFVASNRPKLSGVTPHTSLGNTPANGIYVHDFISEQPNVTINCSSSVKIPKGNDFSCVCRGEGGRPAANVTWYKDGIQIGNTSYEENVLSLSDVNEKDIGTFECAVQSYTLKDKKSIKVIVYGEYMYMIDSLRGCLHEPGFPG